MLTYVVARFVDKDRNVLRLQRFSLGEPVHYPME